MKGSIQSRIDPFALFAWQTADNFDKSYVLENPLLGGGNLKSNTLYTDSSIKVMGKCTPASVY